MKSSLATLLHLVQLMVGNALGDPEVKAFLETMRFPLDRLAEGMRRFESAQGAVVRREVAQGRQMTLTQTLRAFFAAIREEAAHLRFTITTVLRARRDLLAKVGISIALPHKGAAGPPVANGATQPPAPKEEEKRPGYVWANVERFLVDARAMVQAAMDEAEIVEAVAPFGYTKETLEGFLARLTELERLGREQESAKGMKQSATAELSKTGKALRTWYLPWRKRMNGALRGKPEFRVRLGLSA